MTKIEFKSISKSYGNKTAVDLLNLDIEGGQIFGFLGPNGAGKTTTLNMLTGRLSPSQGDVRINGTSIIEAPRQTKMKFGFVPDSPDQFLMLTGREFVNFMADLYDVDEKMRKSRLEEMSEMFSMKEVLDDKIKSYSHGMRQKMMIIGALIHNPSVWILDEPMTGLDPKASHNLKLKMRAHADEGNIVLFSTHVLEVAEKICDRVAVIDSGKILFTGDLNEMRENFGKDGSLEEIFLEMTDHEE